MNELQRVFDYQGRQVRTIMIDGELCFVAKDACEILGLGDTGRALERLEEDETNSIRLTDALGREQETYVVSESGLYSLILGSRKPEAKQFKRWVTHEVLPTIRKTGQYNVYQLPRTYADALRELAASVETNERLEAEKKILLPKAEFFDAVADSKDAITIGEVAKVLAIPGIGRNNLFKILRQEKVLMNNNVPYQEFVDRGYFRVIEQKYSVNGETQINIKTLVYQRGLDYIRRVVEKRWQKVG